MKRAHRDAAVIAAIIAIAAACSKSEEDSPRGRRGQRLEYPVDVAPLEAREVRYSVSAPGTIEAFQQVQITARVPGAVDRVSSVEGQVVKAGDVLLVIENERYRIAVAQAQATLARAQATQRAAEAALQRRLNAQKDSPGLVPGEEIEQKQTGVDTAKADVESVRQALHVAQLNLRESSARAPIAGIVQTRTVQQGQYLQPGAVLATILQREPLLLRFQVTELDAPRLKPGMEATLALKGSARQFTAKLTLVGGAADPATRMVPITAQLDPTEHQYWLRPGAFCVVTKLDHARRLRQRGARHRVARRRRGDAARRPGAAATDPDDRHRDDDGRRARGDGFGAGAETRGPMAIAVLGGLVVSTVLSLFVVPAFYVMADRAKQWLRARRGRRSQ